MSSNDPGNHGEDVEEYWFYLDSTPTPLAMRLSARPTIYEISTAVWLAP